MVSNDDRPQHVERREQLLQVAKTIFANRGFLATTMDDIAREAGFTKPIIYQYFQSKNELYAAIVNSTAEQLLANLERAVAHVDSPRAKIEIAFRVYFEMVVSETDAFRILFIHAHEGEPSRELRALELGLVSLIVPQIDVPISEEHRFQLAASVVGIAEGTAIIWLEQQSKKGWPVPDAGAADQLAERSATLAWGGLRTVHQD